MASLRTLRRAPRPFTAERFLAEASRLRPIGVRDLPFLREMLHQAAPAGPRMAGRAGGGRGARPAIARYLVGWGRPGDGGLIAFGAGGRPVGAAWHRIFGLHERGGGVLALPGVPEIVIAVAPAARACGVGGALLRALMERAWQSGCRRLAVAVDPESPAAALFLRHGFEPVADAAGADGALAMVARLEDA